MNKSILLFLGVTLMAPLAAQAQDAGGYEVQESVTFTKNSSKLSDAAQSKLRADVESLSVLLRYRPESSIEIAGYAESGEKKPGPLADARAQQVWQFLIASGLPPERMEPVGYGAKGKPSSRVDIRISAEDAVAMAQLAQPLPAPAATPPPAPPSTPSAQSEEAPVAVTPPVAVAPPTISQPAAPPVTTAPPAEPAAPPVATAPPATAYTPPQDTQRYSAPSPPPTGASAEPAIEPTPGHEENWAKTRVPPSTPASRAAEQKRLKAEQAAAAAEQRRTMQEAAAETRRADQAAALERKQAAAELKKQQAAEALERKQAAAELKKQQAAEAVERRQVAEEANRQEAVRAAMAQPPPTLAPEAKEATLKTDKGVKIVDNQIAPSYTKPQQAATPKSALPGEGSYFIQGTAYFSANARTMTPGSSATIDALAVRVQKLLQAKPNLRIDVVGHADPLTEGAQADVLAEGRAEELVKELAARGVDSSHLHAAGAADSQPLTSKKGDPARNLNMRAEIRVPN